MTPKLDARTAVRDDPPLSARRQRMHEDLAIRGLLRALARHHAETHHHSRRLERLASRLAEALRLPSGDVLVVQRVALLHDIGKLAVGVDILDHRGRLTAAQRALLAQHTIEGERNLLRCAGLESLGSLVRATHERWDGAGYPDGLAGRAIPVEARIVACADAFDAMTSDRTYRAALSQEEARSRMAAGAGHQFDPRLVDALLAVDGADSGRG